MSAIKDALNHSLDTIGDLRDQLIAANHQIEAMHRRIANQRKNLKHQGRCLQRTCRALCDSMARTREMNKLFLEENNNAHVARKALSAARLSLDTAEINAIENREVIGELKARVTALETALGVIHSNEGRVCGEYGLCTHISCASSHNSWAIADKALFTAED